MPPAQKLRVVILKPSKYGPDDYVERFRRGFMPNSTVPYLHSMTPLSLDGVPIETHVIDEYVQTDLDYLSFLRNPDCRTLLALVGVQSHQFQRSLDLAALACENDIFTVIGGPHPMTCDTSMFHNRGVSFSLAEAEMVWESILRDAIRGEMQPVYGAGQRWLKQLNSPVLTPPSKGDMRRYVIPMIGIYPARGCPFTCNFCSVIKIAGRLIRSQPVEVTMESLRAVKAAGIRMVMFTSDNFNKYPDARELLLQMIDERINLPFFVQCDTQVSKDEEFVSLLSRAGCFQMFVGVESFQRQTLLAAHKTQNRPEHYDEIVRLCTRHQIESHFSNIIGFPDDTAQSVRRHVDFLKSLRPDVASFYILTPIPGTEQYDEFRSMGLIVEPNLDRFDATTTTWRHPNFSSTELRELLFRCYNEYYSVRHIFRIATRSFKPSQMTVRLFSRLGAPLFTRYSSIKKVHPMSGGVGRVRLDCAGSYREVRKKRFGVYMAPLPDSLQLSRSDAELNRRVHIAI